MLLRRCSPMQLVWIFGWAAVFSNAHGRSITGLGVLFQLFCVHLRYGGAYLLCLGRLRCLRTGLRQAWAGRFGPTFFCAFVIRRRLPVPDGRCTLALALQTTDLGRAICHGLFCAHSQVGCISPTPTARTARPIPGSTRCMSGTCGRALRRALSCDFAREDSLRIQVDMA